MAPLFFIFDDPACSRMRKYNFRTPGGSFYL